MLIFKYETVCREQNNVYFFTWWFISCFVFRMMYCEKNWWWRFHNSWTLHPQLHIQLLLFKLLLFTPSRSFSERWWLTNSICDFISDNLTLFPYQYHTTHSSIINLQKSCNHGLKFIWVTEYCILIRSVPFQSNPIQVPNIWTRAQTSPFFLFLSFN